MAQREAVYRLATLYFQFAELEDKFSSKDALLALLGSKPGYSDVQVGASARYRVGAVSLPPPGRKIPVRSLVSSEMRSLLDGGSDLLRSGEDLVSSLEGLPAECAVDPILKKGGVSYGRFLASLVDCDIIERAEVVKERTGCFFVPKKKNMLRRIFDTRRSNAWFVDPPAVELASGEAFGAMHILPGTHLTVCEGDVDVCFYQYEMPVHFRAYFCLPQVHARWLLAETRRKLGLKKSDGLIDLLVKVLPMGFSWSVAIVQNAHMELVKEVLPHSPWVVDKRPLHTIVGAQVVQLMYIDNFGVMGVDAETVEKSFARMSARFDEAGVVTHAEGEGDASALMDFELSGNGTVWVPARRRVWNRGRAA